MYFNAEEEEQEDTAKKPGLKGSVHLLDQNDDEENKGEENEKNNNENENENAGEGKEKGEGEKEESSTEEEDKNYNDVNFWKADIIPNDDIMSALLNDLD